MLLYSVDTMPGDSVESLPYAPPPSSRQLATKRRKTLTTIGKALIVAGVVTSLFIVAEAIKEYRNEPRQVKETPGRETRWSKDMDTDQN